MSTLFKSSYKNIFILSLLVYLITSFFSEGYYHPDEHFQILEFCNYKLGKSPGSDLPWEFHERIRPSLQPVLALVMVKVFNAVSIYNPFTYALIFRMLTAFFSWFVVCKLCIFLIRDFSTDIGKKLFLFLNFFLWFIPSISVRFSSENYSALTFLSAVYLILQYGEDVSNGKFVKLSSAGLLLGFSFFFRFQIAFSILGLGLWLVLIKKIHKPDLLILIVSAVCSISFCVYLDYWFYGEFELTPINYFVANIVENKAANWATYPWWYYFNLFILQAIFPISLLLLGAFFVGLYRKTISVFAWCLIPFLIAHFAVGHKEMRFMFPMVFSFLYLTAMGIDYFISTRKYEKAVRFLFVFSVIVNMPLLLVKMVIPCQEAISYYRFLYDFSSQREMVLLCTERDAYEMVGLKANFYKSPNVRCVVFKNDQELSNYLNENKPDSVFVFQRELSAGNKFAGYKNETIYNLLPKWIIHFNINNWQSRANMWNILELKKIDQRRSYLQKQGGYSQWH